MRYHMMIVSYFEPFYANYIECYEAEPAELEAYHEELKTLYSSELESEEEAPVSFKGADIYNPIWIDRQLSQEHTSEETTLKGKKRGTQSSKFTDMINDARDEETELQRPDREEIEAVGATTFILTEGMIPKLEASLKSIIPNARVFVDYTVSVRGGAALIVPADIQVLDSGRSGTVNVAWVEIQRTVGPIKIASIHAPNTKEMRTILWEGFADILGHSKWILAGDYNMV
ncbi:hypothetical protein R1sor_023059 [Riccia sorocarpa]|uniref:Uncharacterized protein n=1 Tax=Riccia sorocarpa TaxID=122646 RepID=A0ABD3GLL5_9MARC